MNSLKIIETYINGRITRLEESDNKLYPMNKDSIEELKIVLELINTAMEGEQRNG